MDDAIVCVVKGPASRYPRGYLWVFPVWFVILSVLIALIGRRLDGHLPLWLGASEIGGLALAGCTALAVVLTARRLSFWADSRGIVLGSRTARKRPSMRRVYMPWSDVAQVSLVPRRYGVLVDIVLSPAADWVPRPSAARQAALLLGALILPLGIGRGRPALTMPRRRPPGYRVRICETTAGQLRLDLHNLRPDTVPIRVVRSMAALRLITPRPRALGVLRPAWPARSLRPSPGGQPPAGSRR